MDSRSLHELHDSRNKDMLSVADTVYLDFLAPDVLIYQDRLVLVYLNGSLEVASKVAFLGYNLHCASAKHKAWSHKHRISDLLCSSNAVLDISNSTSRRLRNSKLRKNSLESVPVLSPFNGLTVCSDNSYAILSERLCKINGSLSSKSRDNTIRLLKLNNVHYILNAKRLEIKLVRGRVISRNSLRIIVNNDGLIARFSDCVYCMHS